MPPCVCSIRALEVFVKDLSGLTLRQPCTRRLLSPRATSRPFSAASRLRTVENTKNQPINDDIIPFELGHGAEEISPSPSNRSIPHNSSRSAAETNKDHLKDEWHAEIEIVAPWPQETRHANASMLDSINSVLGEESEAQSERVDLELDKDTRLANASSSQSDEVSVDGIHEEPVLQQESAVAPVSTISPVPQKTRAENRQARKLRRLQQGTFRQEAEARIKAREAEAQMKSVLKKIEDIEGDNEGQAEEKDLRPDAVESNAKKLPTKVSKKKPSKAVAGEGSPTGKTTEAKSTSTTTPPANSTTTRSTPKKEAWQTQKAALQSKFGPEGWQPRKRVSPDTLDGIRALHASDPTSYTTATLASHFKITPEAIRRILKSNWRPNTEESEKRRERWEKRGERKWTAMAAQGTRPPAKWRAKGIKTPQTEKKRRKRRDDGDAYVQWQDEPRAAGRPSLSGRIL